MKTGTLAKTVLVLSTLLGAVAFNLQAATAESEFVTPYRFCTKEKCKKVDAKKLRALTGLSLKAIRATVGVRPASGCWVQVGMGPHGVVWRSPCPL